MSASQTTGFVCEVCGELPIVGIRYTKEVPTEGDWRQFKVDSGIHWFCSEHQRLSRTTYLNGEDHP